MDDFSQPLDIPVDLERLIGIVAVPENLSFSPEQRAFFENEARRLIFMKARADIDFANPVAAAKQWSYFEAAIDVYTTLAGKAAEQIS